VKLPVSMWKNAYQVHHWLVAHMPDGEDIRCAAREIARIDLEELLALCKQLLEKKNREQANDLLPWPGAWRQGMTGTFTGGIYGSPLDNWSPCSRTRSLSTGISFTKPANERTCSGRNSRYDKLRNAVGHMADRAAAERNSNILK